MAAGRDLVGHQLRRMVGLVGQGHMNASALMKDFLELQSVDSLAEVMESSVSVDLWHVLEIIQFTRPDGVPVTWLEHRHASLMQDLAQGIYMIVIWNNKTLKGRTYVGSASGQLGFYGRIYQQHFNDAYQEGKKHRDLYVAMRADGARSWAVPLLSFSKPQSLMFTLLAEATMQCLLASLRTESYRRARIPELEPINRWTGLNQLDNLASDSSHPKGDGGRALVKREDARHKAINGGQFKVSKSRNRDNYKWLVCVCGFRLHLDYYWVTEVVGASVFDGEPWIELQCEISNGTHAECFAPGHLPEDEGRRLGIRLSKPTVNGRETYYAQKTTAKARKEANALVAWLTGQIPDPDNFEWPSNMVPVCGKFANGHRQKKIREAAEVAAMLADYNDPVLPAAQVNEAVKVVAMTFNEDDMTIAPVQPAEEPAAVLVRDTVPDGRRTNGAGKMMRTEIPDSEAEDEDAEPIFVHGEYESDYEEAPRSANARRRQCYRCRTR